jgi:hypothetical protein
MLPYWLLFLIPAFAALNERPRTSAGVPRIRWTLTWVLALIVLMFMIGLRHQVGGDWFNYFRHLDLASFVPLPALLAMHDPGYKLVNWVSVEMGWGIYGVNMICSVFFTTGLVMFCRALPRPWLALAVSIPYVVLVLGMGYTRQGVALGFGFLGLLSLKNGSITRFVIWIMVGAMFHRTAVLLLPLAALANAKNRLWTIGWVGIVTLLAYYLLVSESADELVQNYVEAQMQSEGAAIRLAMNCVPAGILLLFRRRFNFSKSEGTLWTWFAVISVLLFVVLFATPSSTVVDRIALYMLPLQLVVFSHLPGVMGRHSGTSDIWVALVLLFYALVLFVWLNFAGHSKFWLPYRFYPLEAIT